MKIRNGFVSNSASSSFVIYGIYKPIGEVIETVKEMVLEQRTDLTEDDVDSYATYELLDILADISFKNNLNIIGYNNGVYVGRDFSSIADDETGKEFRESTKNNIQRMFPSIKDTDVDVLEFTTFD